MGGLWKSMPVTALTFTIAAITMAGIPPFSGFWSKEEILTVAIHFSPAGFPGAGSFFLGLVLAISGLTAFYISRAVILTFFGESRAKAHDRGQPLRAVGSGAASDSRSHESPFVMTGPLMILSLGAIAIGFIGSKWGGHGFQHFLGIGTHPEGSSAIGFASIGVASSGILLALLRYGFKIQILPAGLRAALQPAYQAIHHSYYVDELYEKILINPALSLARAAFRFDQKAVDGAVNGAGQAGLSLSRLKGWFDSVIVDGFVNGVGEVVGWTGGKLRLLQTGLVQNYLLLAFTSAVMLFILMRGIG